MELLPFVVIQTVTFMMLGAFLGCVVLHMFLLIRKGEW